MHQRKGKQVLIYFFLLFLFGSINNINFNNIQLLNINKIIVSGLDEKSNREIINKINNLKLKNIFFLNKNQIKNILEINTLIENYKISKIYPSTLDIKIKKTQSLAKINQNGKILFIGSNGKLSEIISQNQELPFIFGKPKIQEFLDFKKIIDESKFSYNEIDSFYFFPSKRWDIEYNNIVIKLPMINSKNSLDYIFEFLVNKNLKNNSIIDARVQGQIIFND
ncbi:cell division protein FtsQ/DivIB [Candidatus Pelagibacter sp.]|uniref:cell division protein FtsQ/DivIB n=1 Tax=Candidatus Pelagibacter sp. TaxID=2024849 RepID=UPI003F84D8FA